MRFTKEEKFMAKVLIIVIIALMVRAYGLFVREQTIRAAELTRVTDSGYTLSFEGEEHYYTFD